MNKSVAVVTGASQGIGRVIAIRLARDFSAIVLAARNRDLLTEAAAEVKRAGAEPLVCDLDLSRPDAAHALVRPCSIDSGGSMRCSTLWGRCRRLICLR